jgi:hypothetical protein
MSIVLRELTTAFWARVSQNAMATTPAREVEQSEYPKERSNLKKIAGGHNHFRLGRTHSNIENETAVRDRSPF